MNSFSKEKKYQMWRALKLLCEGSVATGLSIYKDLQKLGWVKMIGSKNAGFRYEITADGKDAFERGKAIYR